MSMYNPQTANPSVQEVIAGFINVLVNGGYEGGIPSAEFDYKQQLRRLGCDEEYIASALQFALKIGNDGWQKKYGLS